MAGELDLYNNKAGSVGRRRLGGMDATGLPRGARIDTIAPTYHVASWKGVEFFVDSSSDEFGRRGDLYEYPLGDQTGFKDLGRRARRFKLEGYLIGSDQLDQTQEIVNRAEDPEPGELVHPIFGMQQVSCVTLTVAAEYRKDKKRTRLSFEFVEANISWAPFIAGKSVQDVYQQSQDMVQNAMPDLSRDYNPSASDLAVVQEFGREIAGQIEPARDEQSFDAIDILQQQMDRSAEEFGVISVTMPMAIAVRANTRMVPEKAYYRDYSGESFANIIEPIDFALGTIRRIHADALERLREINAFVVSRSLNTPSVQAIVVITRLLVAREYAARAMLKTYETVKAALDDLDFIMTVYDEEEEWASQRCNDVLVDGIRKARAAAVNAILAKNIRAPGIIQFATDGLWPSLVVAHKLYSDGRRHEQVERYNPQQLNFWMGRSVIAPAS